MENKKTTIMDFIKNSMEYGQAIMETVCDKNLKKEIPAIFIKENQEFMENYGDTPTVESRVGIFNCKNVIGLVLQMKINNDDKMLYETFINCKSELGARLLETLSDCDQCNILLIDGEGELKRRISIVNPFFEPLREKYEEIIKAQWTFEEFNEFAQSLYQKYQTPMELWESLGLESK